ncbi:hypothetical protein ES703_112028 [subsurface metagenome]
MAFYKPCPEITTLNYAALYLNHSFNTKLVYNILDSLRVKGNPDTIVIN